MCDPRVLEFVLPPSLAAGLAVRYQPRVVRSPAAHAPDVRSSGLLPSRARPRPSSPSASAGGKGSLRRQPSSHHTPPATISQPFHQQPTPSSARQKPPQGRGSPSRNPNRPAPPESACGLLAAHLTPLATPGAAAPEGRFPRRKTPPQPL